jgi:XTP/dITP diphosphohydrolase
MRLKGRKIVVASHNAGKAREIAALLKPLDVEIISAKDLNLPEPEETGATFSENAILKAKAAAEASGLLALADDSGVAVDALGGEPGIYSARWAGPEKDFNLAMKKIHDGIGNNKNRRGAFICVLARAEPGGAVETFEGRIDGAMIWPPRGDKGFGYDPIFVADGYNVTFAEMPAEEKHRISHRARAFAKLLSACAV